MRAKKKEYLRLEKKKKRKKSGRRKRIGRALDKKLLESERQRRAAGERKVHGTREVEEIETLEGKEAVGKGKGEWEFHNGPEPFDESEFFMRFGPAEIALVEGSKSRKSGSLKKIIECEQGTGFLETRIRTAEEEATELLESYGSDWKKIEKEIHATGKKRLEAEAGNLLGLIELDRKLSKELLYKPEKEERGTKYFEDQRERIENIAKQVKMHRLLFDSALVYALLEKGFSRKGIGERLGLSEKKISEAIAFLEKAGLA